MSAVATIGATFAAHLADVIAAEAGMDFDFDRFEAAVDLRAPSAPGHVRREIFENLPDPLRWVCWEALRAEGEGDRRW